mmetsp:Transcript_5589/g.12154  ORF Transcript_5589/g.12154 Transcript_5589/m.12154 type:complete len:217 (+) Transcript_5589:1241-1891(+)
MFEVDLQKHLRRLNGPGLSEEFQGVGEDTEEGQLGLLLDVSETTSCIVSVGPRLEVLRELVGVLFQARGDRVGAIRRGTQLVLLYYCFSVGLAIGLSDEVEVVLYLFHGGRGPTGWCLLCCFQLEFDLIANFRVEPVQCGWIYSGNFTDTARGERGLGKIVSKCDSDSILIANVHDLPTVPSLRFGVPKNLHSAHLNTRLFLESKALPVKCDFRTV